MEGEGSQLTPEGIAIGNLENVSELSEGKLARRVSRRLIAFSPVARKGEEREREREIVADNGQ